MSFLFIPFKCWTKRVRNQGWWNPNSMVHRFRRNSPILSRFERCTLTLGSWQSDCHYSYIPWNVTWRLKKGSWKTNLFGMTSFQEPCSFVGNVNQHHLHLVLWNAHTHTHRIHDFVAAGHIDGIIIKLIFQLTIHNYPMIPNILVLQTADLRIRKSPSSQPKDTTRHHVDLRHITLIDFWKY